MKIAFFSDVLVPPSGGIEQYILDVSHALAKRGNEVKVFAPEPLNSGSKAVGQKAKVSSKDQIAEFKKEFEGPSLEFKFIKGLPARALWENLRLTFPLYLYSGLKKWQPDVVHFHTVGTLSEAAVILAKLLRNGRKPSKQRSQGPTLVGTFHSYLMEPEYLKRFNLPKGLTNSVSEVLWAVTRLLYNQCDLVITPSAWVADDIKNHHFTKPIKVVHNGVDLGEFASKASHKVINDLMTKHSLSGKTLLYVGRLSEEKSLDTLLKSVKLLKSKVPEVKLLLVGDGPAQKELEKLARDLGISGQVISLGRINHENLGQSGIYEASQIFVNPSTSETFSLVTIEAMAKGLPIVVAHARAVTELVKDNGFLVDPNDPNDLSNKIYQLLSNEKERAKVAENSRRISLDYSLEKVAENLEKTYRESQPKS